jgi:hypothetical protein
MNHKEAQDIADKHNLGQIDFVQKIALNTGKPMEVGYVFVNGSRVLFCKKGWSNAGFYLCNEFRKLDGTE